MSWKMVLNQKKNLTLFVICVFDAFVNANFAMLVPF
jgi:hypothetical protein